MRDYWKIALLAALASTGCGLKDYEERMDRQAERARRFDQLESVLGDALAAPRDPADEGKSAWRFDVFLRLPRGCQSSADKTFYVSKDITLYRFPFAGDGGKPGWSLLIACSGAAVASNAEFAGRVLPALEDYSEKELHGGFDRPDRELNKVAVDSDGGKIEFGKLEFDGPGDCRFQLFVHEHGRRHVAVIFQTPKDAALGFAAARDACLGTLDISDDAGGKRDRFTSRRKVR